MTFRKYLFSFLLLAVTGSSALLGAKIWDYFHLDNNQGMSNSSVNVIYQDRIGIVWIGTWDGLNRYDGNKFTQYRSVANDTTTLSHPVIRDIQEEDSLRLWIVSDWGLNRFDKRSGLSRRYFLHSPKESHFTERGFQCAVSPRGRVVANFANGPLHIFDKESETFVPLSSDKKPEGPILQIRFASAVSLWVITQRFIYRYDLKRWRLNLRARTEWTGKGERILFDNRGNIWSQSGKDILSFNSQSHEFRKVATISDKLLSVCYDGQRYIFGTDNGYYIHDGKQEKHFLTDVAVTSLCYGTQNILWVGTDGRGIYQSYARTKYINSYSTGKKNLPVRCFLQNKDEVLIGTKGEGLLVYHRSANDSLRLIKALNVGAGRSYNAVFSLYKGYDSDGRIWIGTDGTGLAYYRNGQLFPMKYRRQADRKSIFSVYSIVAANDSTLYLGTSGNGLVRVNYKGDTITRVYVYNSHKETSLQSDIVYAQILDKPYLWLGTRGGGLLRLDMRTQRIQAYRADAGNKRSLVSNDVISLFKDSDNRLWIGTTQGLDLMKTGSREGEFIHVGTESTLRNMNIHNIQEDLYHNIWISTSSGVARIGKDLTIGNFSHKDGLQGDEFSDGAGMVTGGGREVFLGGTNGFSIIYPALIESNGFMPKLIINSLRIDNRPYSLSDDLEIPHGAKSLEFSFSVLDYIDNGRCELSYKLIKRHWLFTDDDSPWINVGSAKTILLNELLSGDYELCVRQSNAAHQWAGGSLRIPFHLSYPLWARWWAVLLYIIGIIVIIRQIYRLKKRRLQRRHQHELEKQRQRNREKIHHAKLRFFSNVTGKFSNNITQIYDVLEHIRGRNDDRQLATELQRIDEYVKQMNLQIKQMSEIQSAEENTHTLMPEKVDLAELLKVAVDSFSDKMLDKDINLDIVHQPLRHKVVTDKTMLSKILYNLLTYIMDNIRMQSDLVIKSVCRDGRVDISLSYTGTAPRKSDYSEIFNSYKALDNFESNMSAGKDDQTIGLTVSNDLAKQMGGSITIEQMEGDRTKFTIGVDELELTAVAPQTDNKPQTPLERILSDKDKNILVIEQDQKMARFICGVLEGLYNVVITTDEHHISEVVHSTIDLVIYDLEENDLAFIDVIRANAHTKYAPIIAICNEGEKESNANILRTGATAILEKPFHTEYLKALVDRNLQETTRLKDFLGSPSAYIRKFDSKGLTEESRHFLLSAVRVLSEHYSDENYNPTLFAQDLAISRTQLYRKMSAAINVSPSSFILEYRMRHAEKMLKTSTKTISEIINLCGFRNRAFFYREFARRYHCLPSEFRQREDKPEV